MTPGRQPGPTRPVQWGEVRIVVQGNTPYVVRPVTTAPEAVTRGLNADMRSEAESKAFYANLPPGALPDVNWGKPVIVINPATQRPQPLVRDAIAGLGIHVAPAEQGPRSIVFLQDLEAQPKDGVTSPQHLNELRRHERTLVEETLKGNVVRDGDNISLKSPAAIRSVAGIMDTVDRITDRGTDRSPMPPKLNLESRIAVNQEYVGLAKDRVPSLNPSRESVDRGLSQLAVHANKGIGPDTGGPGLGLGREI